MRRSNWLGRLGLLASCLVAAVGCHSSTTTIVPETPVAAPQPAPGISLQQIVEMTHKSASPSVIVNMINSTGSTYQLSVDDVNYLRQQGVDNSVIEYMQTRSPRAAPPPPVAGGPPPAVVPVGYYAYPPPYAYPYAPYYGPAVGVGFYGGGRRW